ncbi:MAG: mono/diheme cytochrome c family protein [Marivirga sp.]|jgi:mono/diheme cytochrome c family protein
MKKKNLFGAAIIVGIVSLILLTGQNWKEIAFEPSDNLIDVYKVLGEPMPTHYLATADTAAITRGYDLIHVGKTTPPKGFKSTSISKFYTCTSCHNVTREDPDLTVVDQEARLKYAMANRLPYLQGSTFWGVVNRETWYNDDYVLKYGSLVEKAENSLEESIQLCAQVCAQGRYVEEWEMNSMLAYFWSLQMKVADLDLGDAELAQLNILAKNNQNDSAIIFLKSKYLTKSPATFPTLPKSKEKGYPHQGRPEMGKAIYELGCQHCHHAYGESDLVLDNSVLTFKWLQKNITANTHESIYEIIRKGTYSEMGHKEYMPLYTVEKMSDQQLEDLRAYIVQEAN